LGGGQRVSPSHAARSSSVSIFAGFLAATGGGLGKGDGLRLRLELRPGDELESYFLAFGGGPRRLGALRCSAVLCPPRSGDGLESYTLPFGRGPRRLGEPPRSGDGLVLGGYTFRCGGGPRLGESPRVDLGHSLGLGGAPRLGEPRCAFVLEGQSLPLGCVPRLGLRVSLRPRGGSSS
jgi:hypothetical protein